MKKKCPWKCIVNRNGKCIADDVNSGKVKLECGGHVPAVACEQPVEKRVYARGRT